MTLILVAVTVITCIWTWTNYNRGLLEHTNPHSNQAPHPKEDLFMDSYASRPAVNQNQGVFDQRAQGSRMEID